MRTLTTLGAAVVCLLPLCADAAPSEAAWLAFNTTTVERQIKPGYQRLANSSSDLNDAVKSLCSSTPDSASLDKVRQAFKQAQQDWQSVQHLQFGPVTFLMRNFSLQYWPDKKGIGARQLRQALADKSASYDAGYMEHASVSLKGFPALEAIVFRDDFISKTVANPNYCGLSQAIAANIALMTADLASEWQPGVSLLVGDDEDDSGSAADAATLLLKSLVEPLEMIRDTKLLAVLGSSAAESRWQKSESADSRQSLANIRTNLQALHALFRGDGEHGVEALLRNSGESELAASINAGFSELQVAFEPIKVIDGRIDERVYRQLSEQAEAIRVLERQLKQAMLALDVHLGFNSRDGD